MIAIAVFSAFALLMIYGALRDVMSFTIPNWISLALAGLFAPAALAAGLPLGEVGLHLAVGVAVLAVGIALFAFGWIGGGDAKLLAAASLWMGWPDIGPYLALVAIFGGFFTVALFGARRAFGPLAQGLGVSVPILERKKDIPYGVAIAGAALLFLPQAELGSALLAMAS